MSTSDLSKLTYVGPIESNRILIYCLCYGVLFLLSEIGYRALDCKAEHTRKFVHLSTGLIAFTFPVFLNSPVSVVLLCSLFVMLLPILDRLGVLPSVNAIDRKSRGGVLFPIAVLICYFTYWSLGSYMYYVMPLAILSICDPLAALVGKKCRQGKYVVFDQTKSYGGSLSFFLSAFMVSSLVFVAADFEITWPILFYAIVIATTTTIAEAFSTKGYDNITIPSMTLLTLSIIF